MNYIGSKLSLLPFLYEGIISIVGNSSFGLSDLFAGTGVVGRYFKARGHKIIANDLQYYSYILNRHYIGNNEILFSGVKDHFKDEHFNIFLYLNNLDLVEGFIYKNYTEGGTVGQEHSRLYFTDYNGKKCDTIRIEIERLYKEKIINEDEYFYLLACLLEGIDKVANTTSIYGAYLKQIKKSASVNFVLKPIDIIESKEKNEVYNQDVNKLISTIENDAVYLDPPYNARQYSGNYHILETIAKYDNPVIVGKTGMRDCKEQRSLYCSKVQVKKQYLDLITNIKANYIFLSYNDEGLLTLDEIKEIMSTRGEYGLLTKDYRRYKADKTENRHHKKNSVIEYLHYVKVKN